MEQTMGYMRLLFTEPNYKKYKLLTYDGDNNEYSYIFDFSQDKVFHEDNIEIISPTTFKVKHSPVRKHNHLSGILILANNKTYGKHKDKFVYKCIPDNKYLPTFLVPYNKKNGFNKNTNNLYVTFKYNHWEKTHPYGTLNQVIGPVTDLSSFYEYQLYCKSLNASIQNFTRETSQKLKSKTEAEFIDQIMHDYENIVDRTSVDTIFTIDSASCCDFDDALEYEKHEHGHVIRIHIANVSLWMDMLGLWNSFSDRISTIYLPDRKRPMLPTCLSECLCSLIEKQKRFVFTFEVVLSKSFEITETKFYNSLIIVNKNHVYESQALLKRPEYQLLLKTVQGMCYKSSIKLLPSIKNSHDVVTYLMIMMNYNVSRKLIDNEDGIFRTAFINKNLELPEELDENTKNFITAWNSQAGEYVLCKDKQQHEWLKLETYCHITSPIRRLVDLLNSIIYQNKYGLSVLSVDAIIFVNKWKKKLGYVNTCMKHIRKVQTECSLLSLFHEHNENGKYNIMNGILFNGCKRDDGMYIYNVYLPKIKMLSKIKLLDYIENYKQMCFKLFYFKDENTLKQKIRLLVII
jgi:hypothetical protein